MLDILWISMIYCIHMRNCTHGISRTHRHRQTHTKKKKKIYIFIYIYNSKEVLEVKLPTICRDGKAEAGRVSEEKSRSEKTREGESQKREDSGARKGRNVAIHCDFFQ